MHSIRSPYLSFLFENFNYVIPTVTLCEIELPCPLHKQSQRVTFGSEPTPPVYLLTKIEKEICTIKFEFNTLVKNPTKKKKCVL